ncbi:hypothetical protein [Chloroflexus aurantiacus]|jgi:hypothetical protein|uniref:hypothetical protein n=2 Tax=Chloroflexus aurantiacus TaxID=1108 RepID=UPI000173B07D|nr:hypothetical protein [Chloroflexus aurantiacus]
MPDRLDDRYEHIQPPPLTLPLCALLRMPDRLDDWYEHIQHRRDQDGERYATRRIVSTAAAAAWLPHSKLRDTRMPSGYGNPSSTCRHGWSSALPLGQSSTTAPIAIIPADTHVVDTSYG